MRRRTLLGGIGGGVAATAFPGLLAACSEPAPPPPAPAPDVAVLAAAVTAEERLIALYEAVRGSHGGLAGRIDPLLAHHREHLSVLRAHRRPGTIPSSPAPSPVPPAAPGTPAAALAALRAAEQAAAHERADAVQRVGPGLAQLFASIGACEAGHAAALAAAR
ncbi:hypothetical protein [Actinomadura craniellae]|uniref:hypothetical protein n=1 Tax=Actinomadura craniellae TaxID=2231787 RepID=UPI001F237919|nr:hypothetical protein [Actinomadura craniellae]